MNTSYSEFLVTHPPLFSGGKDPLEADDWLRTTESKFSLLHCTEYQKTIYADQQLRGPAGVWWASYTAALLADHHVLRRALVRRAAPSRAAQAEAGPASHARCAPGRASAVGVGRMHCATRPSADSAQWHLIIFLYFLDIFNSLQIQKFV
jgi:hypothetical protein